MKPKISIAVPFYAGMKNADSFLKRCTDSISQQTFKDYEVVITKRGSMAANTNRAMGDCKGELIKILFMDDYFADKDVLKDIVDNFKDEDDWMITGCDNNPNPYWTDDIQTGNNKLGSPSCLTFRNSPGKILYFDENLSWLLDCDLYRRWYDQSGEPKILPGVYINLGIGDHQHTNILTYEEKVSEYEYMLEKYGK